MVNKEEKEKYLRDLKYSDREIELIMLGIKEGEQQAKKEIKEYYENLIKKIELDFFVMSYAHCVPKKQRDKTSKQVRELREEEWNKALKEAKGDIDKAHDILWDNIKSKR